MRISTTSLRELNDRNAGTLVPGLLAVAFVLMPFVSHTFIGMSKFLSAYLLLPLALLTAGSRLIPGRLYRFQEMKLALLLPVWFVLSCVLNFANGVTKIGYTFFASVTSVAVFCFSFAYMIPEEKWLKVFRFLAWVWAVPMTAASLFGLYLAVMGIEFSREGHDEIIGVTRENRLFLFGNSNTLGVMCVIAFALLLFLILTERKRSMLVLQTVMTVLIFACMAMSDCRSAKLAMLPCIFVFVFLLLRRAQTGVSARWFLLCAGCSAVAVVALFLAWTGVKKGVNAALQATVQQQDGIREEVHYLESRDYEVTDDLYNTGNVRLVLWKYAMEHVTDRPLSLLFGYTPMAVKDEFIAPNPGIITVYDHIHNGYIGILISYGTLGFIGFVVFLVLLLIASCRLLFSKLDSVTDGMRFLPVLLFPILVVNLTEEMLFTRETVQETHVWFALVAGFVFVVARSLGTAGKKKKTGEKN